MDHVDESSGYYKSFETVIHDVIDQHWEELSHREVAFSENLLPKGDYV